MENQLILKAKLDNQVKNRIIEENIPLVIHIISNVLGKYVCTYNSNEYSIGLIALDEAIEKYDSSKGSFSTFASMIIRNRVIDEMRKEEKNKNLISIDEYTYTHPIEFQGPDIFLKEEIEYVSKELEKFNISFEDLVEDSPKHYDTRIRCYDVSEKSSKDENIVTLLYKKLKLPISEMINKFRETKRFLYNNKSYITCLIIILYRDLEIIRNWIIGTLRNDENGSI